MADSIDRLPDELLLSIASRLPLKDAQRLSILGHKWRYFWRYTQILSFDTSQKLKASSSCQERTTTRMSKVYFWEWVRKVMDELIHDTIKEFKVVFDLGPPHSSFIDSWLRFAFKKQVQKLELNLSVVFNSGMSHDKRYEFPDITDPIERLRAFSLITECGSLSSLRLNEVEVKGKALECFLCNCPFLEELCVENSVKLASLETKNFRARRLRLLKISRCPSFVKLDIRAPNLSSCTLQLVGHNPIMSFKDDDMRLAELNLRVDPVELAWLADSLAQISGSLSCLETLRLEGAHQVVHGQGFLLFPDFPRLKRLSIDVAVYGDKSLLCLAYLIESAPLLSALTLNINPKPLIFGSIRALSSPGVRFTKQRLNKIRNLEMLHITGFVGVATEAELVLYVLGMNVGSIKKMVVDFYSLKRAEIEFLKIEETPMAREGFRMIKDRVPPHVQLVVT